MYLSVHLSISLSVCLSVCLSFFLSLILSNTTLFCFGLLVYCEIVPYIHCAPCWWPWGDCAADPSQQSAPSRRARAAACRSDAQRRQSGEMWPRSSEGPPVPHCPWWHSSEEQHRDRGWAESRRNVSNTGSCFTQHRALHSLFCCSFLKFQVETELHLDQELHLKTVHFHIYHTII